MLRRPSMQYVASQTLVGSLADRFYLIGGAVCLPLFLHGGGALSPNFFSSRLCGICRIFKICYLVKDGDSLFKAPLSEGVVVTVTPLSEYGVFPI